jgi:cell wall-associated NlpC family hydrolase/3D (Asp-Asp-Asp) domain-containing protein
MQEHEFKVRDKTVRDTNRDDLTEENLHSGESVRTARRKARISDPDKKGNARLKIPEEEEPAGAEDASREISEHSSRMDSIRGHPSKTGKDAKTAAETSHLRKKKMVQAYSRLSFDDDGGMVRGAGAGMTKKAASMAAASVSAYIHRKGHEAEQDNTGVEAAHKTELIGESAVRHGREAISKRSQSLRMRKSMEESAPGSRLQFETAQETGKTAGKCAAEKGREKKRAAQKFWQKQRYKKAYQAAKNGEQTAVEATRTAQSFLEKAKSVATSFAKSHKGLIGSAIALVLIFVMLSTGLSSCSAILQGATSTIVGTTYAAEDDDIYAVEEAYSRLETELNDQVNSIEDRHPGYDDYQYQVDEISHNPYYLISYFTAKYGDFTYEQVADEVEEIFKQQYSISTESVRETVTETKTVRVGESLGQVVTSGYCNCSICCGAWAGAATASGAYPTAGHTIAVDASNPFVPIGTKVVMNGVEYVVEDTGNFAGYGVQFDVYYGDHASALAHGHQTWEAYIADDNGNQEVEVTSTQTVNRLNITLTNHGLDAVLRSRMTADEEKRYDIYNTTYGNRNYLFDVDSLPTYGSDGFGYEIPAEALSDSKFANMINEAEKYLGYPYVWGGASPSTSFDCSGYVSWVINNCGNGWNVGRQTAEGLRSKCAYVSPSEAKPGDLIFFQGTYDTPGASHVGIYVGNNMMIHCGNPIQYANISSSYWQKHFMAFGRIGG